MRKLVTIFFLLIVSFFCFGQNPSTPTLPLPGWNYVGSPTTLTDTRGVHRVAYGLIMAFYTDTATANSNSYIKFYPRLTIVTTGDSVWIRNSAASRWLLIRPSSGGGGGAGVWGAITGTLSDQTDLQNALDSKQAILNGNGFVKVTGTTVSYDNSTYVTSNIYTANGTITGSRTINANSNSLSFTNASLFTVSTPTSASSPNQTPAIFVDAGTTQYVAEYVSSNTSYSGFLVRATNAAAAPFIQLQNNGNSKTWTTVLETNNSFSIRDGTATGTQRFNISSTTGLITLSSLAGNGTGVVSVDNNGVLGFTEVSLIVQNRGSGIQSWFTSGDTLYLKKFKNTSTISWATDTDSSMLGTVIDGSITYAKIQDVSATNRFLGRITAGSGDVEELTGTQATTLLDVFTSGLKGLAPASGGGTTNFLRADGTWAAPPGGGGDVTKVGTPVNNQLGVWTGNGTIEGDANLTFASSTLNIGVAGASTGIFTQSGATSGTITFQPAAAAGTYTLTWPTNDGDASQVLTTDGSGVLSWTTPSGGGITTLNTLTGATQTFATGTTGTDFNISSSGTTHTFNIPDASSSNRGLMTTGTQTIAGTKTFTTVSTATLISTTSYRSNATADNSNLSVIASNGLGSSTTAQYQIGGATTTGFRVGFRGSASAAVTAGGSYGGVLFGDQGATEATSGTHPIFASVAIKSGVYTAAAGATTDLTSFYIEGAPTGITPTNGSTAMWIDGGDVRLDGNVYMGGTSAGTSATNTLAMYNGTIPSASVTNGVQLYSEDVAASAELKARDEAGNIATLTPHNFTGIPEGRSEDMAWSVYLERNGTYVNVDMLKLARLVEKLTGEKLVYTGDTKRKPNPKNK